VAQQVTLKKDFKSGQGGGVSSYFSYPDDLDSNFVALEGAVNAMVQEFNAIQGPNSALAEDMLKADDSATPGGLQSNGVVGSHSWEITSPSSQVVRVSAGKGIVSGLRVVTTTNQDLSTASQTGPDTLWINVDQNGLSTLQTAAGAVANGLDIATVDIDASENVQIATLTYLAPVFFDGDQYQRLLRADGDATAGVPLETHRSLDDRISNLERLLRGITSNASGGTALGPLAIIRGTESAPGIIPAGDPDTGLIAPAANELALVTGGAKRFEADPDGYLHSASQARARTQKFTSASISSGTPTNIPFDDTELFDVGGWHSTSTNPDEHTVPTGADGVYLIAGSLRFIESSAGGTNQNTGFIRRIALTVNGANQVQTFIGSRQNNSSSDDTILAVVIIQELTAGQIVRMQAEQDSGATMNYSATLSIVKLW